MFAARASLLVTLLATLACGSDSASNADGGAGSRGDASVGGLFTDSGAGGDGGDGGCGPDLAGILRDFKGAGEPGGHPDFESVESNDQGLDPGIVRVDLGADLKPVFAGKTKSTTSADNFNQWFRDTPGVNKSKIVTLPFSIGADGRVSYDTTSFFPLDNDPAGFGNTPNEPHDYHFTFELHTEFVYRGGEVFEFRGDDDVFVFINRKRVVDLGGVHGAEPATVDVDARAAELGIAKGNTYAFDFFFAERHTSESNFRFETTLKFSNCVAILPK